MRHILYVIIQLRLSLKTNTYEISIPAIPYVIACILQK